MLDLEKEKFDIIIQAGQSNAKGSGWVTLKRIYPHGKSILLES